MFVNSDFSDLLRLFDANSVRYLVVGGYAVRIDILMGFAGLAFEEA